MSASAGDRRRCAAQIKQAQSSLALQQQGSRRNRGLLKDGFISPMRMVQIEAVVVDYAAKLEERRSELARAEQRLVRERSEDQVRSRTSTCRRRAISSRSTAARLGEIEQELRKSRRRGHAASRGGAGERRSDRSQVHVAGRGGTGGRADRGDRAERREAHDRGADPAGRDQPRAARSAARASSSPRSSTARRRW